MSSHFLPLCQKAYIGKTLSSQRQASFQPLNLPVRDRGGVCVHFCLFGECVVLSVGASHWVCVCLCIWRVCEWSGLQGPLLFQFTHYERRGADVEAVTFLVAEGCGGVKRVHRFIPPDTLALPASLPPLPEPRHWRIGWGRRCMLVKSQSVWHVVTWALYTWSYIQ